MGSKVRLYEDEDGKNKAGSMEAHFVLCQHCNHAGWWWRKPPLIMETKKLYRAKVRHPRTKLMVAIKQRLYIVLGDRKGWRCPACRSIQGIPVNPLVYEIAHQWDGRRLIIKVMAAQAQARAIKQLLADARARDEAVLATVGSYLTSLV